VQLFDGFWRGCCFHYLVWVGQSIGGGCEYCR
jgi:hypothetical protein